MDFVRGLKRLWRHSLFRRLAAVRIMTQMSDAMLLIAMAAYVLFSPAQQPDAASMAIVMAIVYLPYSVLGPFVSLTLDRFSRRQVAVVTDLIRVVIASTMALLVLNPNLRTDWTMWVFYGCALVAMGLNRYLLAGLSAGLVHAVDDEEYLLASSIMPTVGPLTAVLGGGVVAGVRFACHDIMPSYQADAIAFGLAALGFFTTVLLSLRIGRWELGPDLSNAEARTTPVSDVVRGLVHATLHTRERYPAALGLATIGAQRIGIGMVQVAVILLFRNHFSRVEQVDVAMAQIGLWGGVMGAGYVAAAAIVPSFARRFGVRLTMVGILVLTGIAQLFPGSTFNVVGLVIAGFLLGVGSQALKICVDTLVQAHIDDIYKGRVFTIYDMIFNATFVLAAVLVALLFPLDAYTLTGFLAIGVFFIGVGVVFWFASAKIPRGEFDKHTDFADAPAT